MAPASRAEVAAPSAISVAKLSPGISANTRSTSSDSLAFEKPELFTPCTASSDDKKSTEDKIANLLLNKEQAAASGAKRSTDQASLGTRQSSNAARLSQSEMDALRSQIQECWNPPAAIGAEELRVSVRFKLDQNGMVDGSPQIMESSGNQAADESARRAVLRCGQQGYRLPAEKYEAWRDVVVNFDPSQLF